MRYLSHGDGAARGCYDSGCAQADLPASGRYRRPDAGELQRLPYRGTEPVSARQAVTWRVTWVTIPGDSSHGDPGHGCLSWLSERWPRDRGKEAAHGFSKREWTRGRRQQGTADFLGSHEGL